MTTVQHRPRYVCVGCGRDWTRDLGHIANAPGASLDALCECDQLIVVAGAKPGVRVIRGLVAAEEAKRR